MFRSRLGLEDYFGEWRDVVSTELLFASYMEFANSRSERHPMSREDMGRFLRQLGYKPRRPKRGVVGEHREDVPTPFGSHLVAKPLEKPQPPSYALSDLEQARALFTGATKLAIDWPDGQDEDAGGGA